MFLQYRAWFGAVVFMLWSAALPIGISGCGRVASSTGPKAVFVPDPVSSLAFSPDGKKLATSIGPKGTLWQVESGKELAALENASPGVGSLVFSPDGQSLAGAIGSSIRIWDAATGKVRKTLNGHTAGVTGVGFSPDGKILVSSAGLYNYRTTIVELFIWDAESAKKLAQINPNQFVIGSFAVAPDRSTFATGSLHSDVKIWGLAARKEIAELKHEGKVLGMAYSPDGKKLAVACAEPSVTIWDTATWKEIGKVPDLEDTMAGALAFSPDGEFLAAGLDDHTIKIWEGRTPHLASTLRGHSGAVKCLAYSPVGKTLATGSKDGEVRLWDTSSGETRLTLK